MKKYEVTYEVRLLGAIGIFEPMTDTVQVEDFTNPDGVLRTIGPYQAFRRKHEDKFEFRNPINAVPVTAS